jgi:hypothetical protein
MRTTDNRHNIRRIQKKKSEKVPPQSIFFENPPGLAHTTRTFFKKSICIMDIDKLQWIELDFIFEALNSASESPKECARERAIKYGTGNVPFASSIVGAVTCFGGNFA